MDADTQASIRSTAEGEVAKRKKYYASYEPFPDFVFPASVSNLSNSEDSEWNLRSLLKAPDEVAVAGSIGLTDEELQSSMRDLDEAIYIRRQSGGRTT